VWKRKYEIRNKWGDVSTFVGELGYGALDGKRIARLELFMHVLAYHALLVFLDQQYDLTLMLWARNRRICAHSQIALLIYRCTWCTLRCPHDDKRRNGGERGTAAIARQLEDEARGIVVVRLDGLQFEVKEALRVEGRRGLLRLGRG
jgi:hypothetical protein